MTTTYTVYKRVVNWDANEFAGSVSKQAPPPPVPVKKVRKKRATLLQPTIRQDMFDDYTGPEKGTTISLVEGLSPAKIISTQPRFKVFPRSGAYYRGS